ncbi:[citrate (pro-3S)-lyase] ligase [Azospirillum sp. TSO35-2]|uniref:[citrate (pro-3S)-lyase] ligase n=1 Tax=Azospirillum sp. TSO35-2 TaxID=716796 RepID=UPI000D61867B|nr:[citrate (pro-3S)-lyase] ligase [Azospirillum sp. TSO35-2]PWC31408.1 citrate (pro-3S)-lyase [Azospirillum sp. TSO35-2]
MTDELDFYAVDPAVHSKERQEIRSLLGRCGLDYEEQIQVFVVCRRAGRLVACAGLESNIVKCCAIDPDLRGGSLSLTLLSEVVHLAYERGHSHLFLYTRPENVSFFQGCGFYPLAEVPDYVTLMENTPVGIRSYCDRLRAARRPGATIGGVVINANPFTLGHRYLVSLAAERCDWLHLFVVSEDASFVSYRDRYALVEEGVRGIPRLTLHHGSQYMVSRATFPNYFFKEKGVVGDCCTAIDLLLFRNFIAPALGITHRFVGTEPFCGTTRKYNADMKYWLQTAPSAAPAVTVIEETRTQSDGTPISASEVRRLLRNRDFERIRALVPAATYELLRDKYVPNILPFAPDPILSGGEPDVIPRRAMAVGV